MNLYYQANHDSHFLEAEEARHCYKVLRARPGDAIRITDGRGRLYECVVRTVSTHRVEYEPIAIQTVSRPDYGIHMAVCPTRKAERNEWMVEKMTELGVNKIRFVVSEHTHREVIGRVLNMDRLRKIAVAAMKQSQQCYLPEFAIYSTLNEYVSQVAVPNRYIAYVTSGPMPQHLIKQVARKQDVEILIGPEGDFSETEIRMAVLAGFAAVSLGPSRLRTETAAVAACHAAHLAQIL